MGKETQSRRAFFGVWEFNPAARTRDAGVLVSKANFPICFIRRSFTPLADPTQDADNVGIRFHLTVADVVALY
jgi:hypothetical protein